MAFILEAATFNRILRFRFLNYLGDKTAIELFFAEFASITQFSTISPTENEVNRGCHLFSGPSLDSPYPFTWNPRLKNHTTIKP